MDKPNHYHGEAFCLMRYQCVGRYEYPPPKYQRTVAQPACGHHEIIWNSRDGVTPFATRCPSCGAEMQHVFFGSDKYAPEHRLHPGQKFWRGITREEAKWLVDQRLERMREHDPEYFATFTPEQIEQMVEHVYENGEAPWLDVMPLGPKK